MTEMSRIEFEQQLVSLVANNPEARQKLLDDPKSTIAELLALDLPDDMQIAVHEEDTNTLHFVLPATGDELSAAELAAVAGGTCWENISAPGVG